MIRKERGGRESNSLLHALFLTYGFSSPPRCFSSSLVFFSSLTVSRHPNDTSIPSFVCISSSSRFFLAVSLSSLFFLAYFSLLSSFFSFSSSSLPLYLPLVCISSFSRFYSSLLPRVFSSSSSFIHFFLIPLYLYFPISLMSTTHSNIFPLSLYNLRSPLILKIYLFFLTSSPLLPHINLVYNILELYCVLHTTCAEHL